MTWCTEPVVLPLPLQVLSAALVEAPAGTPAITATPTILSRTTTTTNAKSTMPRQPTKMTTATRTPPTPPTPPATTRITTTSSRASGAATAAAVAAILPLTSRVQTMEQLPLPAEGSVPDVAR